jgi:hypothetical protein
MVAKKKSVVSKPKSKDSNTKSKGPAYIEKQAIKDFGAIMDSTAETSEQFGGAVEKQAQMMLNKYNMYEENVSGKTALQASRDYDKLYRLRLAEERRQAVPKPVMAQKKRPKSTDAAGRSGMGATKSVKKGKK